MRHRLLGPAMLATIVGFAVYGRAIDSGLTTLYALTVLAGLVVVGLIEPAAGYRRTTLAGLVAWAVCHLAGGIVLLGDGRTLYYALVGPFHVDNLVHALGCAVAALTLWEVARPHITPPPPAAVLGVGVALVGLGVGAANETIEFVATRIDPNTRVGGFVNTGRDLVANAVGAGVAAVVVVARKRRDAVRSDG